MRTHHLPLIVGLAVLGASTPVRADFIADGSGQLGDYDLTLSYKPLSATEATLVVKLTNTSPSANGGFLTSFVFNNPSGDVAGATLTANVPNFQLLGQSKVQPSFDDGIDGGPYGQFDLGASTFKSFEGGGPPSNGLGVGAKATFTFDLVGTHMNSLNELSFVNELSVPPGDGEGDEFFVARFRGFIDGGSDKVPASNVLPPPTISGGPSAPEPASFMLAGVGVLGLLGGALRFRRRSGA